jgi:outer membrane lipoprotein-sorting protein
MMIKKMLSILLVSVLVLGISGSGFAKDLSGDDVLDKVEESIDAQSSEIKLKMELYNDSGSMRERKLEAFSKDGEYDKALIRFLSPANVEGTAFLAKDKAADEEDMYLYMPVLGNVRKIAGSQKNGSFVGTDFSYNDLSILGGGNYKEDYKATVIEKNSEEYLLKLIPTDEEIEYKFAKMWVKIENYFPTKLEFYDQKGELHKVLNNEDIQKKDGYWTAEKLTMKNVQKGSKTVLYLEEITYDKQVSDRIFTTRYLRR